MGPSRNPSPHSAAPGRNQKQERGPDCRSRTTSRVYRGRLVLRSEPLRVVWSASSEDHDGASASVSPLIAQDVRGWCSREILQTSLEPPKWDCRPILNPKEAGTLPLEHRPSSESQHSTATFHSPQPSRHPAALDSDGHGSIGQFHADLRRLPQQIFQRLLNRN
jgi:hypothetical protein